MPRTTTAFRCVPLLALTLILGSCAPALHKAVSRGDVAEARRVLDAGASVHRKDREGNPPIALAAADGRTELVELLLERGANVDDADATGWTPLMLAAAHGHEGVVVLLMDAGASVTARSPRFETPLWAAAVGGNNDVVRHLLEADATLELPGNRACHDMFAAAVVGETQGQMLESQGDDEGAFVRYQFAAESFAASAEEYQAWARSLRRKAKALVALTAVAIAADVALGSSAPSQTAGQGLFSASDMAGSYEMAMHRAEESASRADGCAASVARLRAPASRPPGG